VNCISCETQKITPGDTDVKPLKDGSKRGLWVTDYKIDFAKCCFCGLCTEPCPTEAIKMTPEFEYTKLKREDLIYTFSVMTPEQIQAKKDMYEKFQAEKKKDEEAKKAAAAKEAEKKPDTVS
jgi:NADH-quinone oxidoreductase subunit I